MKNILDSRKIIDTKNQENLLKQIEAKVKGNNDPVLEGLLASLASLDNSLLNQVSKIWDLAVEPRRAEALEVLLDNTEFKKNINVTNSTGLTPLMRAAKLDNASAVRKLLAAGAECEILPVISSEKTVLHYAIESGKARVLRVLISSKPMSLEILNELLMLAVLKNNSDAVKVLLKAGADITAQITGNSKGLDGVTALYMAASLNKIGILELLLKHQDIKKVLNLPDDENGFTPLMRAVRKGHAGAVSKLIGAGADITIQITGNPNGWDGATALYLAATLNKIKILELLLKHKDIKQVLNLPKQNGYTPLMGAAFNGHAGAVSKLMGAGADITIQITGNPNGWDGATALYFAATLNKIKILELLLKHKDTKKVLNLPNKNGYTPLMGAAFKGHTDTVSRLIEAGVDITIQVTGNFKVWGGARALHIAASLNKIEVLELLLKHKDIRKALNLPDKEGFTPLMRAAFKGHTDKASRLIEAGADITVQITGNSDGLDGLTALHIAAALNKEVLELLLKHKDIKKVLNLPDDENGFTPLMRAVRKGHAGAVSKLIGAGADITIQITGNPNGWDGATALYLAATLNKIKILELLLKHKDIKQVLNLPKQNGYTPLMGAAFNGHAGAVSKLMGAGADITIQITGNPNGWDGATALYFAATLNKIKILELLLKHKDTKKVLNLPNKNGYTALMGAAFKGHTDTVSRLIEAGVDITIQVTGNFKVWGGATALHIAAWENKIEVLELLLKHKDIRKALNLPDKEGFTPLMRAAFKGHTDKASRLIEAGADITVQITGNSDGLDGLTALHIAAALNKEVLELLLKHKDIKKVLNLPNKNGFTPLISVAKGGHADTAGKLIEAGADITIQATGNSDGWDESTALHMAASSNKIEILELLLKHKDIKKVLNLPKEDGYTPLMDAAKEGHADAVSKLIEAGADITIQVTGNSDGWGGYTALHIAASEGHADVVSRLIEVGADVTIQVTGNSNGWDGATALHIAASKNKVEVLELLLKHKDIKKVLNLSNKNGYTGYTPLMDAASKGHADAVSKLIEAGADITIQVTGNSNGWDGYTALHIAASLNKIEVLELLLKHKDIREVLNFPDREGITPLMRAASKGHADAVSKLIEAGADITTQITGNSKGWDGATALHIAVSLNKIGILELLLKHEDIKKVLNLPDKDGYTPLMDAASKGHADAVSSLIEAGADITSQIIGNSEWNGYTALHIAASKNKIEVLELLLKHKDIREVLNLPNKNGYTGYTPLMDAAKEGHADAVSKLIEAGADITIQVTGNSDGWGGYTALHIAASEGHAEAVSRLIEAGADITAQITGNSKGWDGATALYIAVSLDKIEVLELLLKHKDIREVLNLPNENGYTPLMDTAYEGHADAASRLIEAGADVTVQNHKKNTAAHLAAKYQKGKSLGMLIDKAPKVLEMLNETGHTPGELLNSRQKRSSSEVSIFSNGAEGGGKQKRRRIQTNSVNW